MRLTLRKVNVKLAREMNVLGNREKTDHTQRIVLYSLLVFMTTVLTMYCKDNF